MYMLYGKCTNLCVCLKTYMTSINFFHLLTRYFAVFFFFFADVMDQGSLLSIGSSGSGVFQKRLGFLFDSALTAFLMMGNLSPVCFCLCVCVCV